MRLLEGGIYTPPEYTGERLGSSRRPIEVLWDLDGVIFKVEIPFLRREVPPLPTAFKLLAGNNLTPKEDLTPMEWQTPKSLSSQIGSRVSVYLHQKRPLNPEAVKALMAFKQVAQLHGRILENAVLTGRTKDKHKLTVERLREEGCLGLFESLYLNIWESGTQWKMAKTRWAVQLGKTVIGVDDDIRAGLAAVSVGPEERVREYVIRNASNSEFLLRRGKVKLPGNLVLVRSFEEAVADFDQIIDEMD